MTDNISRAAALKTLELCVEQTEHFDSDVASFVRELLVAIRAIPQAEDEHLAYQLKRWMRAWAEFGDDPTLVGEDCDGLYRALEKHFTDFNPKEFIP